MNADRVTYPQTFEAGRFTTEDTVSKEEGIENAPFSGTLIDFKVPRLVDGMNRLKL